MRKKKKKAPQKNDDDDDDDAFVSFRVSTQFFREVVERLLRVVGQTTKKATSSSLRTKKRRRRFFYAFCFFFGKNDKNEIKKQVIYLYVFAIGRALRSAPQDPEALYLDLCREALGFCLHRLNTASSLRESHRRRLDKIKMKLKNKSDDSFGVLWVAPLSFFFEPKSLSSRGVGFFSR